VQLLNKIKLFLFTLAVCIYCKQKTRWFCRFPPFSHFAACKTKNQYVTIEQHTVDNCE